LCLFNKDFQPAQLDADGFKQFTLHHFQGLAVDLTQPTMWSKVATAGFGEGISRRRLARVLAKEMEPLGAVLTPKLLNKMVAMFLIHGPELADDLKHANRQTVVAANG
jgi:hypothetical protein